MFASAGPDAEIARRTLPHDPGRWFEPNANSTPVINIGALGGDAPDDIFGG